MRERVFVGFNCTGDGENFAPITAFAGRSRPTDPMWNIAGSAMLAAGAIVTACSTNVRLVVLATQERLAYGTNFEGALTGLLGDSARPAKAAPGQSETPTPEGARPPAGQPPAAMRELINRASEEFNAYQRHTAEGRLSEAGESLEALKAHARGTEEATGSNASPVTESLGALTRPRTCLPSGSPAPLALVASGT